MKSKLPHIDKRSISEEMSALANEHSALNLAQGFPQFPVDPHLSMLLGEASLSGMNQYAPTAGRVDLRTQIARMIYECYDVSVNPLTQITITAGASQALFSAFSCLVSHGDEVILFSPCYDSYNPGVIVNGGKPVYVELQFPDFSINWQKVEDAITERTKLIVLNNPHNPCTSVLSVTDIEHLTAIIRKYPQLFIISDEVYEHIVFSGKHLSLLMFPELREKSIIISSFGKTLHVTGWKIGYCVAPDFIMDEFRKVHIANAFCVNNPAQQAIATYITNQSPWKTLPDFYRKKRDIVMNSLSNTLFKPLPCNGTYFILLDYSNYSDIDDTALARRLTIENKVALLPLSMFHTPTKESKLLRLCFAKEDDILEKAVKILHALSTEKTTGKERLIS